MPKFILNKLVRDKIPEHQISTGQNPVYRTLERDEHTAALAAKVIEEAKEIPITDISEAIKEIADVQQALDDLREILGITTEDVHNAQTVKNEKAGAFKEGRFVESVSPGEDNKWTDYYRTDPGRFIEVAE